MAEDTNPLEVIRRKGGSMGCPVCADKHWVNTGVVELTQDPRTEVLLLSCGNCGFVRMHDTDMLKD
jgi:hypothetical protein